MLSFFLLIAVFRPAAETCTTNPNPESFQVRPYSSLFFFNSCNPQLSTCTTNQNPRLFSFVLTLPSITRPVFNDEPETEPGVQVRPTLFYSIYFLSRRHSASMPVPSTPVDAAIAAQPSSSDKPGTLYIFGIPALQPNLAPRPGRVDVLKIGRTNKVPRRKRDWARKCSGQVQDWIVGWEVPFAAKFGASLSVHIGGC